ncbi:uncharacterized protein LOC135367201 isoform X2 [Ornithodoros turicata]|uniref:uncharacterized protein LOC135367201 isoform X2 n=1 Tax=Ornithodoros turicata TaxID=34597 RepID=UPI003138D503
MMRLKVRLLKLCTKACVRASTTWTQLPGMGTALEGVPRSVYHIATKVGRYEASYDRMFDFSARRTQRSVQESLQRLGLRSFDVLQVHDVEFAPSVDYIIEETLPVLESLRRNCITRYIGITGYPLSTIREIVEKSPIKIDMILSYCRGTLFDDTLQSHVSFFEDRGLGIANAAVLGMGLLTPGPLPSWHPAPEEIREACCNAQRYCQNLGINLEKLALWYSMNHFQGIHTTVVGMTTPEMVRQNLDSNTISTREQEALNHILERYFAPLQLRHWEGRELAKVRSKLAKR